MASPDALDRVFVYGTLRQGFTNPGREILDRYATFRSMARVPGSLFELDRLPILIEDEARTVRGELYKLTKPEAGLEALDRYEGATGGGPGPYERRIVQATLETGETVEAWTYVWTDPIEGAELVPEGDYVAYVASKG